MLNEYLVDEVLDWNRSIHVPVKKELSQEDLKKVLHYDPVTGIFTYIRSGKLAGAVVDSGYVVISVRGRGYPAHRLAFLYVDGYMPEMSVDHINRNRADNRRYNLREASPQCQARNCSISKNNSSGVKGVHWIGHRNKWQARIKVLRVNKHLGLYDSYEEAACARLAAEQCLGFQDCNKISTAWKVVYGK